MKQILRISCLLFFSISLVACDKKLVTDTLAPSARSTSEIVAADDNSGAPYCGVNTKGANPRVPAPNEVLVGYSRWYDSGTEPFPCWRWGSAVYRGAFRFDLSKYMGKKIVSAVLTLQLGQAQYVSGSVASNEGVWARTLGLGTSNWWEKPNPNIGDLFPFKPIPGMPDLPYGLSPPAQSEFPVKYSNNTYTIEVSNVVRDWLDGTEPNSGFILVGSNENTVPKSYSAALSPVTGISLEITTSVPK